MAGIFLHEHPDFPALLKILEEETSIVASLIEKDYWIMHALYGLQVQGYSFQLKGGTSLSKGFNLIDRFSEDIDIHIDPPLHGEINENPKNTNKGNIEKKKRYYDELANQITIEGITEVHRDKAFDDTRRYNSGGIRLIYPSYTTTIDGLKQGILLEAGFDTVTPNLPRTISSWAYERAVQTSGIQVRDNRAIDVRCYDPRYTFVEKLQTICTKFRREQESESISTNYMRQYYDLFCLLSDKEVQQFIGTDEYFAHKKKRFPKEDLATPIREKEAFTLKNETVRASLQMRYQRTKNLYYKGQPAFEDIMARIHQFMDNM